MYRISLPSIFYFILSAVCLIPLQSSSQQVLEHKKGSFVDSLNRYHQQADLPVYIFIATSLDEKPKALKEVKEEQSDSIKPIYLDGPGVHHLRHSDALHNKVDIFKIYADGVAPVTSLTKSANAYKNPSGKQYYGKDFSISLSSKDDMSGVDAFYVSINGAVYAPSNGKLQFEREGSYRISYYAVDKVGNVEKPQLFEFDLDLTPPKTYYTVIGPSMGNALSASTLIRLNTDTEISGVAKTWYSFDQDSPKLYPGKDLQLGGLTTGQHTLYYWSVDNTGNTEDRKAFEFFLDKTPPIASIDILGDKFVVDNKIYLSGRTKIKITAVDNKTDIKELKYSINNAIFQDYNEPFYMPNKAGAYTIQYFVSDNLNNRSTGEMLQSKGVIYVDLLGPALSYKLEGPMFKKRNEVYVGLKTKFTIEAKDMESGLKSLAFQINGLEEQAYSQPFAIGATSGKYSIEYIGYDNVNNRNQRNISLNLDAEGPRIIVRYSTESEVKTDATASAVYPSYTMIYIAATDAQTTCSNIYYSINGSKESIYTEPLKGFEPNKKYKISIRAKDALDNETVQEIDFLTDDF